MLEILKNNENLLVLQTIGKKMTISSMIERIDMNKTAIQKTIDLLLSYGLLEKQNQHYVISSIGEYVLKKLYGIEFLSRHSDYFETHSLEDIPKPLLSAIESFSDCQLIEGVFPTSIRLKEISLGATTFLNCIFTQPPFLLADIIYEKMQNGVKPRLLFGKNANIYEYNDVVKKLELDKLKHSDLYEKRICDNVLTNILISDSGACLLLGNNENSTDIQHVIVGYDKQFINWCNGFFNYKWKEGQEFARLPVSK